MTTPAALASGWTRPVRAAEPPFDAAKLAWIKEKVQAWAPYVDGLLLEDLAVVQDNYMPGEDEIDDLAQRLRGHHMRLSNLALTTRLHARDEAVARLVDHGRALRAEELPGDHHKAVGHLRRMAWALDELLELMVKHQCLTEAP